MIGSVNGSVKVLVMGSVRGLVMVSVTYSHHSDQMYQGSEVSKNPGSFGKVAVIELPGSTDS